MNTLVHFRLLNIHLVLNPGVKVGTMGLKSAPWVKLASWVNTIQVPNPFGQDAGRGAMEGIGEDEWIVSKDKVLYQTEIWGLENLNSILFCLAWL